MDCVLMCAEISMTDRASFRKSALQARRYSPFPVLAIAVAAIVAFAADSADAAGPAPDVEGLIHVCSSCHGLYGRNNSSSFPNLAGQQKQFLMTELTAMRDHKRSDPHVQTYMWGMTAQLTNEKIAAIADYYSRQTPATGTPSGSPLVAVGRQIFENGIPARGVPACQSCHGPRAQGNGAFPRLAGQHAEYISRELGEFASGERANEVMHQSAKNLTPQEIEALAAYLDTL
jgi:cytochrome c553